MTETAGGAMLGYCAIGRVARATRPNSIRMIARTQAKTGRSMKKRDIGVVLGRSAREANKAFFEKKKQKAFARAVADG